MAKPETQAAHLGIEAVVKAAMFLVYADPKLFGKTTLMLRAFPRALFVGERSSIQSIAESGLGITPEPWQFFEGYNTLPRLVELLQTTLRSKEWQAAIKAHGVNAIYIDDFSHICANSVIEWSQTDAGKKDRYYKFNLLDQYLSWVPALIRDLGLLCGMSAHKLEPKYETNEKKSNYGQLIRMGAPEVPSSQQVQAVPGWADFVAPVTVAPPGKSLDPWWPRCLSVNAGDDTLWIAGDRTRVAWQYTPANLREILLAAPTKYHLPRARGLEWMDDWTNYTCERVLAGDQVRDIVIKVFSDTKPIPGSPLEVQVQWAVQDGLARATIQRYKSLGVVGRMLEAGGSAAPPPPPPTK